MADQQFQWEYGLEVHRIPLTDALMHLIEVAKDDENIHDIARRQSTTVRYDTRAILNISIAETELKKFTATDWDNDLVVTIARGGELLADFYERHWHHEINVAWPASVGDNVFRVYCLKCDETLTLDRESLMRLEDE